jgi:hypothetical protein
MSMRGYAEIEDSRNSVSTFDSPFNPSKIKALQRLDGCSPSFDGKFEKLGKTLDNTANIGYIAGKE